MTLNLQPIIDNWQTILFGLGFVFWAISKIIEARAKANPAQTWEDDWLPWLDGIKHPAAQGVEWLAEYKASKGDSSLKDGAAKLKELTARIEGWEKLWKNGQKTTVVKEFAAWYFDLAGKAKRLSLPFSPTPNPPTSPLPPAVSGAGDPEKPAVVNGVLVDPNAEASDGK